MTKSTIEKVHKIQAIQDNLRALMHSYGYMHLAIPTLELAEIFLTRAGNQIIDEMIAFNHKANHYALRPEFTASAAQLYSNNYEGEPVRWQFSGQIYRDTDHEKLQQNSSGAEFIGEASYVADAEIIAIAAKGLDYLNITDWEIVLGHVGLLLHLLKRFGLDSRTQRLLLSQRNNPDELQALTARIIEQDKDIIPNVSPADVNTESDTTRQMLDSMLESTRYGTTMGGRQSSEIAERLITKHLRETNKQQILEAAEFLIKWHQITDKIDIAFDEIETLIHDETGLEILNDWKTLVDALGLYDIPTDKITIKADLAKDWEYYTGMTFAIRSQGDTLATGGRYDELISVIGNSEKAIPAVGFAYTFEHIVGRISYAGLSSEMPVIVSYDDNSHANGVRWATQLRTNGFNIALLHTNKVTDGAKVIHINTDNIATYNDTTYSNDILDKLIAELRDTQ